MFNSDFLKLIPKTDLHVHLDGSLRLPTLIELAKERRVHLPSYEENGMRELVFKSHYSSLEEYLQGFSYTCAVMQDEEAIERIAYELAYDNFNEGVRYVEVRLAPQLLANDKVTLEDVLFAVDKGMKKAKTEINKSIPDDEPNFEFGIIVCAMRFCNEYFSGYYKKFFTLHKYSKNKEIIRLASLEMAKATVQIKQESDAQIVAFDLAGAEKGYPAEYHKDAFAYIHKNFLNKTVHAGEAYGAESIFKAITDLHADRLGHGLHLFDDNLILEEVYDRKKYVKDLVDFIANRRVTLEVCLTSNLQTSPEIKKIGQHPLKKMLENKISITLCTDNRLMSDTSLTKEVTLAVNNFSIDANKLKDIIIYGFKRSFFAGAYSEKRVYVRKAINYYEKLEKKYNIK